MNEPDKAEQLRLATAGDPDAIQRLMLHYHATLRGVIAEAVDGRLQRHVDPDDVLQQTYIAAFKALRRSADTGAAAAEPAPMRFDHPGHFYKWLERIALNQLKDIQRGLRRRKRDVAREAPDQPGPSTSYPDLVQRITAGQTTPSRAVARDEATAAVMTCLARLGDDQREVIRLRIIEDVPVREIAQRLGKTEVAVYALTRRGLQALKDLMDPITRYLSKP